MKPILLSIALLCACLDLSGQDCSLSIIGNPEWCVGDSVSFFVDQLAPGDANYEWFLLSAADTLRGEAFLTANRDTVTVNGFAIGSYTLGVRITDAAGFFPACIKTIAIAINGVEGASITVTDTRFNLTATAVFCSGTELILTASGGVTYEWSTGESTPRIGVTLPTETPPPYSVRVTTDKGCSLELDTTLTVIPVENPTLRRATDGSICPDSTVELIVGGLDPNSTYSVVLANEQSFGLSGDSSIVVNIGGPGAEEIAVQSVFNVTTGCGNTATTGSLPLAIPELVEVTIDSTYLPPCTGGELVLSVLDAGQFSNVTWRDPAGTTFNPVEGTFVGPAVEGLYTVTALDPNGCLVSDGEDVELGVRPDPPTIAGPMAVCGNQLETLYTAEAPVGSTLRWAVDFPGTIVDTMDNGVAIDWGPVAGVSQVTAFIESSMGGTGDGCTSETATFGVEVSEDQAPEPTEVILVGQDGADYFLLAAADGLCYQWGTSQGGNQPRDTFRTLFLGEVAGGAEAILQAGYYVETWSGDCSSTDACRNRSLFANAFVVPDTDPVGEELEGTIFPNPVRAGDRLRWRIENASPSARLLCALYSADGRLLRERTFTTEADGTHRGSLPLGHLATGFYLLRLSERTTGRSLQLPVIVHH